MAKHYLKTNVFTDNLIVHMEDARKEHIREAIQMEIIDMLWGESDAMDPYTDRKYVMENLFMVIVDENYGDNNMSIDMFIDRVLDRVTQLED